ncbi:tetratricopeptide repeat protein [Sphingobium sp. DEHP117]|uniref:tetratricopeptide repeat protein n=1 Tax=Sphingobium sp. DEHP117 TaxID=2993436 RepID=UPI0027D6852E|nr:tetratricopeptide repeat protein [Sphingobium sp. DEHP117]MDQ4420903.1 tetratricopeptide repeat protein [Sphingobium sp. DEHP117]
MGKPLETMFMNAKRCARRGEFESAQQIYEAVLLEFPKNVRARQGLEALRKARGEAVALDGAPPPQDTDHFLALLNAGRLEEALSVGEALIESYPRSVLLHDGVGRIHYACKNLESAAASFRNAVAVSPDCAEAHYNLARVLQDLGKEDDALASYEAAIAHKPDYADAYNNLGALYVARGAPHEAIAALQGVLKLRPDYIDAYINLGNAFRDIGNNNTAVAYYKQALALQPTSATAHFNLGRLYNDQGKKGEAIMALERAIVHAPDNAEAHRELANILLGFDLRDEAILSFDRAIAADPNDDLAWCAKLHQQAQMCDWEAIASAADRIPTLGKTAVWGMLSLEDDPARHRTRSECAAAMIKGNIKRHPFVPSASDPGKKIRIGYFSADFWSHAVMHLIARLFEMHDRSRFEVHAFSYGKQVHDAMHERLVGAVDVFHQIDHFDDGAIAARARECGIDIAVDLMGHTKGKRLGIFAYGAAPIQISYLGYPGTSGADFIDYMIADAVTIPQERRAHYSENMLYMPHCYQPNDNCREISARPFTRADMGLPEDAFVFACFNSSYKITPEEFDIWMRLLEQVEGSVLWLYKANRWAEANLRKEAERRGVDPARVIFAEPMPVDEHLARQHLADLFLDTFNVNAHTTASDALWGGLPLLTRMGKGFAARVAGSLLHAVGLPELAVETSEAYEAKALELATNPQKLKELRERLAANRLSSPLFDTERFVRNIEAGYLAAYDRFCKGQAPDDIRIVA